VVFATDTLGNDHDLHVDWLVAATGGCLQVLPHSEPGWQHMPPERLASIRFRMIGVKHGTGTIVSCLHSIAPHAIQPAIAGCWLVSWITHILKLVWGQ
jgi:hypothetical protein